MAGETPPRPAAACPYCLGAVLDGEPATTCPACHSVHHAECWAENGGCGQYGCAQAPAVDNRRAIEVPVSYWGQEHKPCPSCGQQIVATAVRCRHCGATFASARPEDNVEFSSRQVLEGRLPEARKTVVTVFVLSVIPFLAPVGMVWGAAWRREHREELGALPPLYAALSRIGLYTSVTLTTLLVVMTCLYSVLGTHR
jgi:hypothetical protein